MDTLKQTSSDAPKVAGDDLPLRRNLPGRHADPSVKVSLDSKLRNCVEVDTLSNPAVGSPFYSIVLVVHIVYLGQQRHGDEDFGTAVGHKAPERHLYGVCGKRADVEWFWGIVMRQPIDQCRHGEKECVIVDEWGPYGILTFIV